MRTDATRSGRIRTYAYVGAVFALALLMAGAVNLGQAEHSRTEARTISVPKGDVPALIAAINAANANPQEPVTINIQGTYDLGQAADARIPFYYNGNTGLPAIRSEIVLSGENATIRRGSESTCTIDGVATNDEFRILHVAASGDLTLHGLTLSHGCADDSVGQKAANGGALVNQGTLTIRESTLSRNRAYWGGGIDNGGDLNLVDSAFSNNRADWGGGIHGFNGSVEIRNAVFSDNTATSGGAGLAYHGGTSTVVHSTFTGNTAQWGGAIANGIQLTIEDTRFSGNTADFGGAVANGSGGDLSIQDSTFTDNAAQKGAGALTNIQQGTVTLRKAVFSSNQANNGGGAIGNADGGTVKAFESVFQKNHAKHGGAIVNGAHMLIRKSTFSNNSGKSAGGIANHETLSIRNATFANNAVEGWGGAITNGTNSATGTLHISSSTFVDNEASNGNGLWNNSRSNSEIFIKHSIVFSDHRGRDCSIEGKFHALGKTISGDTSCPGFSHPNTDPLLDAEGLEDNGGPTLTVALRPNSPAVNAVNDCTSVDGDRVETDQRGESRPRGTACDVGAFELVQTN